MDNIIYIGETAKLDADKDKLDSLKLQWNGGGSNSYKILKEDASYATKAFYGIIVERGRATYVFRDTVEGVREYTNYNYPTFTTVTLSDSLNHDYQIF